VIPGVGEDELRARITAVDLNADGSVCMKIGEPVNPHFGGRHILFSDNQAR
jgi:hypothetical protein